KELNIKHSINFLALQETKMTRVTHMDVKFIKGNSNYQYVFSDPVGASGGILCVWEAEEESREDNDMERVSESVFDINSSSHKDGNGVIGDQVYEDPFGFYGLLKNQQANEVRELSPSMSHPLGFTLEVSEIRKDIENKVSKEFSPSVNAKVMSNSQKIHEESNSDVASPYVVYNGGSVLGLLEDMIRVGQAMGYSLERCEKDLEKIIGSQGVNDVI
nr:RNA-directed DNA polymerase, eukaryota [Tanacetum cinerariifolium]